MRVGEAREHRVGHRVGGSNRAERRRRRENAGEEERGTSTQGGRVAGAHVVLARQLHPKGRRRHIIAQQQQLHLDRLERARLLRSVVRLLDAELKGDFALVDHAVAARKRRVHVIDRRKVERRQRIVRGAARHVWP